MAKTRPGCEITLNVLRRFFYRVSTSAFSITPSAAAPCRVVRTLLAVAVCAFLVLGGCGGEKTPGPSSRLRLIQSFDDSMVRASPLAGAEESQALIVDFKAALRGGRISSDGTTSTLRLSGGRLSVLPGASQKGLVFLFPSRKGANPGPYDVLEIEIQPGKKPKNAGKGTILWDRRGGRAGSCSFDQAATAHKPNGPVLYSFPLYREKKWGGTIRSLSIVPAQDEPATFTLTAMRFRNVAPADQALAMAPIDEFPERKPSPFLRMMESNREIRNVLVAPPRTEIAWTLRVPPNASLSFGTAARREILPGRRRAAGVAFKVRVEDGAATNELYTSVVDADADAWTDHRVSLDAYANKDVTLVFATAAAASDTARAVEKAQEAPTSGTKRVEVWGFWSAPGVASADASADAPRRNLALLSLDCLRLDRVGFFGYSRDTTPEIDALARKGLAFDYMYAHAAITPTSHHCMLQSLYPIAHGITREPAQLPAEVVTLGQIMRRNGYLTVALVGGTFVSRDFGYQKGFDIFMDERVGPMSAMIEELRRLLDAYRDEKVFLFLHTYDMHEPYVSDPAFLNFFDPDYEGSIGPGTIAAFEQMLRKRAAVRLDCFATDRILECENLIADGGFENEGFPIPPGSGMTRSAESPRRGAYCGFIPATADPNEVAARRGGGKTFVEVAVRPETVYVFGGYMKSRDLRLSARFVVEEADGKRAELSRSHFTTGTSGWERFVSVFKTSATCKKARFYVPRLIDYQGGDVWVDDLFLVPFQSIPAEMRGAYLSRVLRPEDVKRLNDMYDGSVRYVDSRTGEIARLLESSGFLNQGVFAISSDHGQDLMDHGSVGHGHDLSWDSVLRVPFVVYGPLIVKKPDRVSKLCESVDIAPTLLTLIGIEPPRFFQGMNILDPKQRKDYIFASYEKLYTIVTPDHRFRYDAEHDKTELNVHASDPNQKKNVAKNNPELVGEYRRLLDELIRKYRLDLKPQRAGKEMSPELIDKLKTLGYL